MDAPIKAQWVAALRSGKYRQGQGYLCSAEGHCCLGVLCDLHAQAHPENPGVAPVTDSVVAAYARQGGYLGCTMLLPDVVAKWAGMNSIDGDVIHLGRTPVRLPLLNDGAVDRGIAPHTFNLIADLIEAQL